MVGFNSAQELVTFITDLINDGHMRRPAKEGETPHEKPSVYEKIKERITEAGGNADDFTLTEMGEIFKIPALKGIRPKGYKVGPREKKRVFSSDFMDSLGSLPARSEAAAQSTTNSPSDEVETQTSSEPVSQVTSEEDDNWD